MKSELYPYTDFDLQLENICKLSDLNSEDDTEDIEHVRWLLEYHCCEPSAAAERIAEYLGLKYADVSALL